VINLANREVHLDEDVLSDVLGVIPVVQYSVEDSKNPEMMALDQFTKSGLIARTNPLHQIDVISSPQIDRLLAMMRAVGKRGLYSCSEHDAALLEGLHENSLNPLKSSVLLIRELDQVVELLEKDVGHFTCRPNLLLDHTIRLGRHGVRLIRERCLECHSTS
jgi:hypothetical protein